jgi:hypothetical protein
MKRLVWMVLVVGLVVSGVRAPVARAALQSHTTAPVDTQGGFQHFRAETGSAGQGFEYMPNSTGTVILDGVTYAPTNCMVYWGEHMAVSGVANGVQVPSMKADGTYTLVIDVHAYAQYNNYEWHWSGSVTIKSGQVLVIIPLEVSVSGDATPYVDESVQFTHTVTGGIDSHYGYWEVYNSVGGLEYGGSQVANGTALTYSFGHAGYHDVTYTAIDSDNSTAHGHFMTTAYEDALDCSLSGPSQAAVSVPVNFTATGSGGVVHTGDSYDYRLGTRFGADAVSYGAWGTSGTLSKTFGSNGTYTVVAQVRDSHGATHDSNEITVYVGDTVEAGAYRWSACRRGVYGENIDFTLFQYVNGAESQLMGSAWTLGSGEMAWYNATGQVVHSAVDAGSITMTPGGGGRTWYSGEKAMSFSFVITHGAVSIPVIGSFGGISGCAGGWNQTDGTVINPETFPAEEATGWGWLDPLRIMFEKLFNLLFVPTEAQMRTLMPSGTLGASLLEGTSWGSAGSTWQLHVHWGAHEIVLVNLTFADYASNGFVVAIRTAVQIAYLLAMVYMVVVLL